MLLHIIASGATKLSYAPQAMSFMKITRSTGYRPISLYHLNNLYLHSHSYCTSTTSTIASNNKPQSPTPLHNFEPTPKSASLIPGPRRFPVFGSSIATITDKDFDPNQFWKYFEKLHNNYGSIVRFDIPLLPPTIFITNPDDMENVFRSTMDNPIRFGLDALKSVRYGTANNFFDKKGGLLVENYEEWYRVRSRVQKPMMRPKTVAGYIPAMDSVALDFIKIIEDFQNKLGEMPSDFQEEIYKWALESVGLVAFNRRLGCLDENTDTNSDQVKFINTINEMFDSIHKLETGLKMWRFFKTPTYRKLEKGHTVLFEMALTNIQETEEALKVKPKTDDDLTLMEQFLSTPGLTKKDTVTMILDMVFAGLDTTSHTIGFVLYLLSRNPSVQTRLQQEVDEVLGDSTEVLTAEHLARLTYMKMVIKESLRLYPIAVGNARALINDVVIQGYLVPKGWMVMMMHFICSRNNDVFPRASEFIPERWQRDRPLGPIHPFASLPFSAGTRMCIGRRIAEQELYIFLARAMQRFTVDYKYKDQDINTKPIFVPSEPLKFNFYKRDKTA